MTNTPHTDLMNKTSLILPVDPEPTSLRIALLVILLVSAIIGYFLTNAIFSIQTCSILGVLGGLAMGAVSIQAAERLLKPRWKSNRFVRLQHSSVEVVRREDIQIQIDPSQEIETHLWRFEIPRRHRVPKGWYVVAIALEQNAEFLPVFTLISPEAFNNLPFSNHFVQLSSRKEMERESQANLRLAGQQRRLLKAEGARNMNGVEMLNEDFEKYLQWLQKYLPEWMPSA